VGPSASATIRRNSPASSTDSRTSNESPRANQKGAYLVEQLGKDMQNASEINLTSSPANQIFGDFLFNRARDRTTRQYPRETLI
jgi:hypothetical protein